jgi:toxin ParE1/3/4
VRRATYLKSARADRRKILDYIIRNSQSVRVGQRFMQKLVAYCDHLASLPFQHGISRSDLRPGLRSSVFEAYVIFFQYADDRFEVVNILEGHRDIPEYFSPSTPE